jgi:choline dehydrogenase-like flavoprotein
MYLPPDPVDFLIVGDGSAGCALASRLSEDAGTRVLPAEAGRDGPRIRVPTRPNRRNAVMTAIAAPLMDGNTAIRRRMRKRPRPPFASLRPATTIRRKPPCRKCCSSIP